MIRFRVRPNGSGLPGDELTAEQIVEGVQYGDWQTDDEVWGPNDTTWTPLETHPVFAAAMAEYEPPPPPVPEDETRLDMNPLIDVALVLLIFFILTTTYEELRKEFLPPPGQSLNKQGKSVTDPELKKFTIRVTAKLDQSETVFTVEGEKVAVGDLESKLKEWMEKTGHSRLAMEIDPDVPWKAVVSIQDAASGAKIQETIRIVRPPRE